MTRKPPEKPDYEVGRNRPPKSHRFVKGQSGNPGGRPRGGSQKRSVFDIMFERTVIIEQNGRSREASVEEALEQSVLQMAFKGNRAAGRKILKMMQAWEDVRQQLSPATPAIRCRTQDDPDNANPALIALGIAEQSQINHDPGLKLLPWGVQAAVDRRPRKFSAQDLAHVKARMLHPELVRWPKDLPA